MVSRELYIENNHNLPNTSQSSQKRAQKFDDTVEKFCTDQPKYPFRKIERSFLSDSGSQESSPKKHK